MMRTFTRPIPLALLLALCTVIPVLTAAVAVVQILLGALPEDSLRPAPLPVTFLLHLLAGVLFGVLGPLQFIRALRSRFGALHRLAGRVLVLAGAGLALLAALVPGVVVARARDMLGMWLLNIALAGWLVRSLAVPRRRPGTASTGLVTKAAALALPWVLCGCAATTSVEFAGQRPATAVCQDANAPLSAMVVWGPRWRPDQKDVGAREQAAERGLTDFFATHDCFAKTQVQRLAAGTLGSLDEAKAAAAASGSNAQRVVYVVVRELGPVVKLLSSAALIEGGTEVVLDIAVYDLAREQQVHFTTHWRHGGGGVVKGVASLPGDMRAALAAALGVRAD